MSAVGRREGKWVGGAADGRLRVDRNRNARTEGRGEKEKATVSDNTDREKEWHVTAPLGERNSEGLVHANGQEF